MLRRPVLLLGLAAVLGIAGCGQGQATRTDPAAQAPRTAATADSSAAPTTSAAAAPVAGRSFTVLAVVASVDGQTLRLATPKPADPALAAGVLLTDTVPVRETVKLPVGQLEVGDCVTGYAELAAVPGDTVEPWSLQVVRGGATQPGGCRGRLEQVALPEWTGPEGDSTGASALTVPAIRLTAAVESVTKSGFVATVSATTPSGTATTPRRTTFVVPATEELVTTRDAGPGAVTAGRCVTVAVEASDSTARATFVGVALDPAACGPGAQKWSALTAP